MKRDYGLITTDLRPSNTSYLHKPTVDYRIWGAIQGRVCQKAISEVVKLKQRIFETLSETKQGIKDQRAF